MKKRFRGGFMIYVRDTSGAIPRKTPKPRLAQSRMEMWEFVTECGYKITARNIEIANKLSLANGWGLCRSITEADKRRFQVEQENPPCPVCGRPLTMAHRFDH